MEKLVKRRVLNCSIDPCVHTLGVEKFAEWMETMGIGYLAVKLGPAVSIDELIDKIRESKPEVVSFSYRLGDLHVDEIIVELIEKVYKFELETPKSGIRYCFGGLRPAANLVRAMTGKPILKDKFSPKKNQHFDLKQIAEDYKDKEKYQKFFDLIVDDYVTMAELDEFARNRIKIAKEKIVWSDDLLERIKQVRELENRPILRAHIGAAAETIQPTVDGVKTISEAGCLEIVSLAPDQVTQAFLPKFDRGEENPKKYRNGEGGSPIRSREDLKTLKDASKCGNRPMTRIYSGTDELVEAAKIFEETLHMPFPAVPIFFYNRLDGRGPLSILDGINEHFNTMRWWASIDKPLEINDPHQWQLRRCSDDMYVTDHILCGIVALKMGLKNYVMQLMFDLPPEIEPLNDLAKMKAAFEIIEPLTRNFDYNIIKETRGGLSSFPPNLDEAKSHLSMTTYWQMFMNPDIVHVVSYCEAHHDAKPEDIVASCDITKQSFREYDRAPLPDIWNIPSVADRKEELKKGAMYNIFHLALMGGYEGKVTFENFSIFTVSKEVSAKREKIEEQEMNYETMLLDLIDGKNYPSGECNMISGDNLDLALQVGLFQAPQVTVIDKRYELTGMCRTKIVDGCCRIDTFCGKKVKDEFERVDIVRNKFPWYFDKNISQSDDRSAVADSKDVIEEDTTQAFREELGITDFKNKKILAVDFGSTYTKVAIFDSDKEDVDLRYIPTTINDIREGLANGLGCLSECKKVGNWDPLKKKMDEFDVKLPCSSAKGGLKMITVSLTARESGFASDLAALTAGAKLLNSYHGKLSEEDARNIYLNDQPEIILLTGGVNDGGDTETVLHNARILAGTAKLATYAKYGIPVIYSGNEDVKEEIEGIFHKHNIDIRITENLMPEVNNYNIEVVNEAIRELFQTVVIRGKGFDVVEKYMSAKFIPTPRAAFLGINLLARGYGEEEGIGNIVALDIGGCTTDYFANVRSNPLYLYPWEDAKKKAKRTILKTPNYPLAYRRVEGKYGLAYNARNLMDLERYKTGEIKQVLDDAFNEKYPDFTGNSKNCDRYINANNGKWEVKLEEYLKWISDNPHIQPETEEENFVRSLLASETVKIATANNVGHVKETDVYFLQEGVNFFTEDCTLVLVGGTIYHKCKAGDGYHMDNIKTIAKGALFDPKEYTVLRSNSKVLLDASYILSTVGGLYGRLDPEKAIRILKKNFKHLEV
ncbi:MAG: glutamate mutase L [Candidatus Caldatribacteriota bacterium]|nr:glutamate mutase L [Candidatus Caldatribacteriota bacterium]